MRQTVVFTPDGDSIAENTVDACFEPAALAEIVDIDSEPVPEGVDDGGRTIENDLFGPPVAVDGQVAAGRR